MRIDPLTHQPIDKEKYQHEPDDKTELLSRTETYDKINETENFTGNTNDISLPYHNMLSENINVDLWNKNCKTCYSPSISLEAEESINFSTTSTATESSSNVVAPAEEQDSLQQWMDSIFSCAVNQLEEDLFFLRKYN